MSALLPLFPLDLVLLPGVPLPLHIFEPRYKEMISECLEQKRPFGVVRAKEEEGVAEIGCTAEIITVTKEYPDGKMDIVTQGRERFEVMEINQERSFLQSGGSLFPGRPGGCVGRRGRGGAAAAQRDSRAGRRGTGASIGRGRSAVVVSSGGGASA